MRRKNNSYNQEVTLFVGTTRIFTINKTKQMEYAFRTIRVTQKTLYTYKNPLSSEASSQLNPNSKSKSSNLSLSLEQLVKVEHKYQITTNMRPKLLDKDKQELQAFLRELKAPKLQINLEISRIVAIACEEQGSKFINGFIFQDDQVALQFYESINQGVASQIYFQLAQTATLPYNYRLSNSLGDTLNGTCVIDPEDFSDSKAEEQVEFFNKLLKLVASEPLNNYRNNVLQLHLKFKIIDDESKNYACKFIQSLKSRVQSLNLQNCNLNNNQFTTTLYFEPFKLIQNLPQLLVLNLSNNTLTDDFFTTATNLLRYSKSLHNFNLAHNMFTLQKEGSILSFLQSVSRYKIILDLSHNKIQNTQAIIKYFINAQGNIPLEQLDISSNCFEAQHAASIAKSYLERKREKYQAQRRKEKYYQEGNQASYFFKLIINQLEFQDASSFEFLKMQNRHSKYDSYSCPLGLSKHPFRKAGKQVVKTEEELNLFNQIDELFDKYQTEIIYGNFYKMKQIKDELVRLGVQQQMVKSDSQQINKYRSAQEDMIINKMQKVLNFRLQAKDVVDDLNECLIFVRRKGLTGQGVHCLTEIKFIIQQKITIWERERNLGHPYLQYFYKNEKKHTNSIQNDSQVFQNQKEIQREHQKWATITQQELKLKIAQEQENKNIFRKITYIYFFLEVSPDKLDRALLQHCLTYPLLSSIKIIRDSNLEKDLIKFKESERIAKVNAHPKKKKQIDIESNYGLESYKFSQAFVQSGQSTSGYNGMLSNCRFVSQGDDEINKFIKIFNNFMKLLYQTPDQLSDQSISEIIFISEYLIEKQNQQENDLKCVLMQELLIRMMTYFDSQKHRPLKRGLLLSVCEFLLRRVQVEEQSLYRLTAYFIKTDSINQQQIKFHVSASKLPWEGKIDWKVKDPVITKELILNRGRLKVSIVDVSKQQTEIALQIDELDTVADLWTQVKEKVENSPEFTDIDRNELNFYWLCGTKTGRAWDFQPLTSYQQIGKLIFQDQFQRRFFLRRTIYPPQFHSLSNLRQMKYEDLVSLFCQARQSFRQSAHIMLSQNLQHAKVTLTVDIMWIEALREEQSTLGVLRRQPQSRQAKERYVTERQNIISQLLANYLKYLPFNCTLSEENRQSLITKLQAKIKADGTISQKINQIIKQQIIKFIQNLGICAFTTTLADQNNSYLFYCNNKSICFQDRSQNPPKRAHVLIRHLLWFQVFITAQQACLKFDIIQDIDEEELKRYTFSIYGSSRWLGQIYSLIVNICRIRAFFPIDLLCGIEDDKNGVIDLISAEKKDFQLQKPPLETSEFCIFSLPRMKKRRIAQNLQYFPEQVKIVQQKRQKQQKIKERQELEPVRVSNNQVREKSFPMSSIPEKSAESSSKRNSEKNLQIQQILQAVSNERQPEQQIITTKRSSFKNAPTSKRKSRNR